MRLALKTRAAATLTLSLLCACFLGVAQAQRPITWDSSTTYLCCAEAQGSSPEETWNARIGTGAACGPGTRRPLLTTASSFDPGTQALDATGHTWNRTESARTLEAGNWQVLFWCATGSGGGPQNTVTVQVHRRDSACAVLQTIADEAVSVNKGTTEEYATTVIDPGAVTFASGEILTVVFIASAGNQSKTLRFDATNQSADTRLVNPGE